MYPRNILKTKTSILSVLSGDIFDNSKIWPSLYAFKIIYYFTSAINLKRSWIAMKRRAYNIRDMNDTLQ